MKIHIVLLMSVFLLPGPLFAQSGLSFGQSMLGLPPLGAPETYGEVLMDGDSPGRSMRFAGFSHWIHRVKYTCRVCHYELEFSMKRNETPIVCNKGQMNGRYCAVCHNGNISFGPKDGNSENCSRCHGYSASSSSWDKFKELQAKLPKTGFGDEINWSQALNEGKIKPEDSISGKKRELVNIKTLVLQAEMGGISSSVFPHKTHEQWLDCSNCHPELFNIKKKTTATLRMNNMVKGESCGICHLHVAFPLDDCRRCHPAMRQY